VLFGRNPLRCLTKSLDCSAGGRCVGKEGLNHLESPPLHHWGVLSCRAHTGRARVGGWHHCNASTQKPQQPIVIDEYWRAGQGREAYNFNSCDAHVHTHTHTYTHTYAYTHTLTRTHINAHTQTHSVSPKSMMVYALSFGVTLVLSCSPFSLARQTCRKHGGNSRPCSPTMGHPKLRPFSNHLACQQGTVAYGRDPIAPVQQGSCFIVYEHTKRNSRPRSHNISAHTT